MTIDPSAALSEIAYLLERAGGQTRRATAFRAAAASLDGLSADERAQVDADRAWASLPGIGDSSAAIIAQATDGRVPAYLRELREAGASFGADAGPLLGEIRGELHSHTVASDGHATLPAMVDAARALGRDYLVVTDHSPSLKVAHGLSAERLRDQRADIAALAPEVAPFRILSGIEVDILADGSLDQEPALLAELDLVVASVHSKLRMDADAMTLRMVAAIASPLTDVLGHCTGRLIAGSRGTRPQSAFDAEVVFEACRQFGKAVEINCRPERLDPPDDLLALASEMGCLFSIDTDAHALGQLEWTAHGTAKAARASINADRIVNTWPVERLLEWTASHEG